MRAAFVGLLLATLLSAQNPPQSAPQNRPASPKAADDYSGTYSFLQEGEFVQLTVEDDHRVTGFVSRYGDADNDHGTFLDHFFKEGKLEGKKIFFTTRTVHGTWYQFTGAVDRGEGKNPGDEAYYILRGTLVQNSTDANQKPSSKSREVAFKSFPRDLDSGPSGPNQ